MGNFGIDAKPADLISISRQAIDTIQPATAAKNIAIELAPESGSYRFVAAPERLQQVVSNLLSNSVKFTEEGGRRRVALGYEEARVDSCR